MTCCKLEASYVSSPNIVLCVMLGVTFTLPLIAYVILDYLCLLVRAQDKCDAISYIGCLNVEEF